MALFQPRSCWLLAMAGIRRARAAKEKTISSVNSLDEEETSFSVDVTTLTGTQTSHQVSARLYEAFSTSLPPTGDDETETDLPTTSSDVIFLTGSTASHTSSWSTTSSSRIGSIFSSSSSYSSSSPSTTMGAPPAPTNTQPCNGYVEYCERSFGNLTVVGCHNSPFVREGSVAANQAYDVTAQLNDGVRFLQAQIQWPANGTEPHFCHTTCDLLDAGPITHWLGQVRAWVASHPYDVVTVLLGNGNYSTPDRYAPYIEKSGLVPFLYTPQRAPLPRTAWPTLASMILSGRRVVMFLDYKANQTAYPWLLDEFSHMWETPFDPVDKTFPCDVQRPSDLPSDEEPKRLHLMNHNLNAEVSLLGSTLLVPAVSELNMTNAVEGPGSLGMAANNCRTVWNLPPNVLNVDYYNYGSYPGSVFEVAAQMNNVTFRNQTCCGVMRNAAPGQASADLPSLVLGLLGAISLTWL